MQKYSGKVKVIKGEGTTAFEEKWMQTSRQNQHKTRYGKGDERN